MNFKSFIKSASFKSIVVLLCTLLISGVFLTFANALLKVTDQERFDRAISKIYGEVVETEAVSFSESDVAHITNAEILEAYKVTTDGNYLVKSKGNGGYENGSVTCWVVIEMTGSGELSKVGKVVIDSNVGQSYIDRIGQDVLDAFSELYTPDIEYTQNLLTGATVVATKTALCNSVNGALDFIKAVVIGEEVIVETIFDDFAYTNYIDKEKTAAPTYADGVVTYENIVTLGNGYPAAFEIKISVDANKTVSSLEIVTNGSTEAKYATDMIQDWSTVLVGKNAAEIEAIVLPYVSETSGNFKFAAGEQLSTGATMSNFLVAYAALFATANYDNALATAFSYTNYIDKEKTAAPTCVDGVVTYENIVTLGNGYPSAFEVKIVVGADKTLTSLEIVTNGSTEAKYAADMIQDWSTVLVGKNAAEIEAIVSPYISETSGNFKFAAGEQLSTGATMSNFLVAYAALYATANYDLAVIVGGAN